MSLGNKSGCTQPNNEKSINPYVSSKGHILVSDCCGAEATYSVSDKYGWSITSFCPMCMESYPLEWLEVKEADFDREIYLNENDEFKHEGYDEKTFQILPICDSEVYTSKKELLESGEFDITLDENGDIYEIKNKGKK
jgi:hypothetical protein